MRLPWGQLSDVWDRFLQKSRPSFWGCLSFEERSTAAAMSLFQQCAGINLLVIEPPADAFPDYRGALVDARDLNRERLSRHGVRSVDHGVALLIYEDALLDLCEAVRGSAGSSVVIDITSLPKRIWCFLLKAVLSDSQIDDVLITYTQPAPGGYPAHVLAEDLMSCDSLPGYVGPLPPHGSTLVMAVGFQASGIRSVFEMQPEKLRDTKFLLSFPPDGDYYRRQWESIRLLLGGDASSIRQSDVLLVPTWDAEEVYRKLSTIADDSDGLALAPFGPKPHTLGMALLAIKRGYALYYTQPKAYFPGYSQGIGATWAYVVKWRGLCCFDRGRG